MPSKFPSEDQAALSENLVQVVLAYFRRKTVTRDEIEEVVGQFAPAYPSLTTEDLELVVAKVETLVHIELPDDVPLVDPASYSNWLTADRVASTSWDRWNAYVALMSSKNLSPLVIDRMGHRSEKILELAGDPTRPGKWSKRGLVIGDVQSGKTANYLALFNKAADVGYKVIILFGGHTDKLRRQTQARVDEGFVGRDSRKVIGFKPGAFVDARVGVGFTRDFAFATSMTTWSFDFSTSQLRGINLSASAINGPVVFVIKKNKRIIENLIAWLHTQHQGEPSGQLDLPMLLLDDEADYASINTSDPDDSPTAINSAIRDLVAVFSRNSYVGFTATPFANVFIDPEQDEDLFPRDYIYGLESPSNYFGPEQMFQERAFGRQFLSSNDDAETWLPYNHKSGSPVGELPESLLDAVAAFFLVNTIRDIRGSSADPRTMMVNVSRFNSVQTLLHQKLADLVSSWRHSINQGVGQEVWERLERVFLEEYASSELDWEQVQMRLAASIHHIQVHLVNSKTTRSDEWDAVYSSDVARVIAVGGDVLSRGLTLEGLSISYFRRRSLAYDTLMQMGRWFGYRPGYEDLCKLWIDPEVAGWYDFIAQATSELRDQIARMRSLEQTPRQFGLAVRRHPGAALMATALNKRRHSDIAFQVSLRNRHFESVKFEADASTNYENYQAAQDLLGKLHAISLPKQTRLRNPWWDQVPLALVSEFISKFRTSKSDLMFADGVIEQHLLNTRAPWMANWHVVVMTGDGNVPAFEGLVEGKRVRRAIYKRGDTLFAGGQKLRLGGRGDEGQVLSDEDYAEVRSKHPKSEPSDFHYREKLKSPLLLVYPIQVSDVANTEAVKKQNEAGFTRFIPEDPNFHLLGVHVAFPQGDDDPELSDSSELVSWQVNKVWLENNHVYLPEED